MSDNSRIYLLPNLMTAGNLFCGFAAALRIHEGAMLQDSGIPAAAHFYTAIALILAACVFDVLDGRLARLGGNESAFGREFDSLADVVSFGVAPALLVFHIVLAEFPARVGWIIAFIFLLCGALRLARFNVLAAGGPGVKREFTGFPIPAAAGLIASLTLMMLWFEEGQREIGPWKYALPPLMLYLSFMMFSRCRYPSFKNVNWRTKRSIPKFIVMFLILALTIMYWEWMPAVLFLLYLFYGFFRPWFSKRFRRELLDDDDDIEEDPVASASSR